MSCDKLRATFLVRKRFEFCDGRSSVDVVAENGDVDVFGKAFDQTVGLGQRCPALEEQARLPARQLMVERLERPADSEVFLDIADRRAKPVGGREKSVETIPRRCGDQRRIIGRAHERVSLLLKSSGLKNSCIHIGNAPIPLRRSSRVAWPCLGSAKTRRKIDAMRSCSPSRGSMSC